MSTLFCCSVTWPLVSSNRSCRVPRSARVEATPGTSSTRCSTKATASASISRRSVSVAGRSCSRAKHSPRLRTKTWLPYPWATVLAASMSLNTERIEAVSRVGCASQSMKSSITRSKSTLFSHSVSSASKTSVCPVAQVKVAVPLSHRGDRPAPGLPEEHLSLVDQQDDGEPAVEKYGPPEDDQPTTLEPDLARQHPTVQLDQQDGVDEHDQAVQR